MTVERPSPTKFGGKYSESEPETQAVVNFIRKIDCDILLSFHSQGKEIYYDFNGFSPAGAEEKAEKIAKKSGYTVSHPTGTASYGGCKDWFISEFGRMGFTVEIGTGKNPLPVSMLDDVYEDNARLILCAVSEND